MCGDIYTKAFTDLARWLHACNLINVIDPAQLTAFCSKGSDVPAAPAIPVINTVVDNWSVPSHGGGTQTTRVGPDNALRGLRTASPCTTTKSGFRTATDDSHTRSVKKEEEVRHVKSTAKSYNRVLVEACCGPDSLLSQQTKASEGCLAVGLTKDEDFTSNYGIELAKWFLIGK